MSSPEASPSIPFRSKKTLKPAPKSVALDHNTLSSKTPEKPPQLSHRARNRNVALSIKEVRRAAESLRESSQKQSRDRTDRVTSARRQIASWPDEAHVTKSKNHGSAAASLPERYEILCEFFNCLDSSIRLLRLKGLTPTFTNICPKIECLTDRRFTYGHLAQLKFILPEVIEIKKVLVLDERTSCMKPNLHVTMNVDAVENDGKFKSEGGNVNLRKVFRTRLADFSRSHPAGHEVPEETLPEPFNCLKQDMHSKIIKIPSSSSPKAASYGHTDEQPAEPATSLRSNECPEEIRAVPSDHSKENLYLNIFRVTNRSLPMETSSEAPTIQQQTAVPAHFSKSFRRHFSQKGRSNEAANSGKILPEILQPPVYSVPSTRRNTISFSEEPSSAQLGDSVNATPSTEESCIKSEDGSPTKNTSIHSTPSKLSTPARLMTTTPALRPPKRCYMSPDDDSIGSPNKLVRRPPRSRSLKFDTPVKNKEVKDEVLDIVGESVDSDILDILPESLLQSIRDKERKAMEEQNPAISQAKRRQKMITCLPKLFNMIHFLFQSINRSVITREELIHKLISSHSDIIDRREVEEQLCLLLELVPDWISEKLASGGDFLIRINKMSCPESIRSVLEEAKQVPTC
ncbi:hypothetical protein FNV43_RR23261 [Rhamnella rubrinervis]|uniref:CDT1 Geminin-binding domain-containing protein n=1 Tax=Rhamnella rubrinervis TaxID=2594499 RepID=A0A8K0DXR4_9ROSA|nr:hypothetical protein FNV43_RR23261 [Rhamnella rubrinervis]